MNWVFRGNSSRSRDGFTMIEVAIGLMLIAILAGPYVMTYNRYLKQTANDTTVDNISVVKAAMRKYVARNGAYPRPASRNLAVGSGTDGKSVVTAGIVACSLANATVCRATTAYGVAPKNTVLIGAVPYAELGLTQRYSIDGYGEKFTYAVTEYLTDNTHAFDDTAGIVSIVRQDGKDFRYRDTDPTNSPAAHVEHYVIVSHGYDKKGGFTNMGVQSTACGNAVSADDENCDNDAIFNINTAYNAVTQAVSRIEATPAGPTHYDDRLDSENTIQQNIWVQRIQSTDIYALLNTRGSVLIAQQPNDLVTPNFRVDVRGTSDFPGHIRVQGKFDTPRLCDYGGCTTKTDILNPYTEQKETFSPAIIGGTPADTSSGALTAKGIACGNFVNGGTTYAQPMTGISKSDELCLVPSAQSFTLNTCPTNWVVHGTNASGQLICTVN